jgi:VWFA-related protein
MRNRVAVLALFCLGAIRGATAAETLPPLVESIEVRVVSLDVVVTDKAGNRVTGLTKDDFEVFERGRLQPITNFSEIGAETGEGSTNVTTSIDPNAPARRTNTVVFFIDANSIDPRRRHIVFDELQEFSKTALLPGDRAMVVVWNRTLRIAQAFTETPEDIQRALRAVGQETEGAQLLATRRSFQQLIRDDLEDTLEQGRPISESFQRARLHVRAYSEEMFAQVRAMLFAVDSTMAVFGGTEDKKVFVFVGEYLPTKAGAEMIQYVDELYAPYPDLRELMTAQPMDTITLGAPLTDVIRQANASGATMYMIAGGGLGQLTTDSADRQMIITPMSRETERRDTMTAFAETSEQTGGIAFLGNTDPHQVVQQIAEDFRTYYSIGFRPTSAADGKERTLKVRAKNPAYEIRSRKTYVLRSIADEMADRVTANFHQAILPGELTVTVKPGTPSMQSRNAVRVPVSVVLEGDRVTLLPRGNSLAGEVTVFVCAGGAQAESSKVLRHTQRLSIPAKDEKRFRNSHLTFSFEVVLNSAGEKLVSAGVLDTVSGSFGIARAPVHAGADDLRRQMEPPPPESTDGAVK